MSKIFKAVVTGALVLATIMTAIIAFTAGDLWQMFSILTVSAGFFCVMMFLGGRWQLSTDEVMFGLGVIATGLATGVLPFIIEGSSVPEGNYVIAVTLLSILTTILWAFSIFYGFYILHFERVKT